MSQNKSYFKNPNEYIKYKGADCSKKIVDIEKLQYDEKHQLKIVKTGTENIYEKIQVNKDTNNIRKLMQAAALAGTPLQYADNEGKYLDVSKMPKDVLSTNIAIAAAKDYYNHLDPELTKGLSIDEFVKTFKLGTLKEFIESKKSKESEDKE